MSIGIASVIAGAAAPPQGGATGAIETPSEKNAEAATMALKAYNQPKPSGGAERTETASAVRPTPTNASATVVDFNSAKKANDDMPEYPIFGPDQFAKTMASRNAAPVEDAPAEPQNDIESVAVLEARAQELRAANSGGVGDIEPVAKSWEDNPGPDRTTSEGASERERDRLAAESTTSVQSSGAPETAAEAAETRLTD